MTASTLARPKSTFGKVLELSGAQFVVLAVGIPHFIFFAAWWYESITLLNYTHVICAVLWTGFDLLMGILIGPVLGRLPEKERARVVTLLIPRTTFLLPSLAGVTIFSGIRMATVIGHFDAPDGWVYAALALTALIAVIGFGKLLPNEIRIFAQLVSDKPDFKKVGLLGQQNARIAGVQGFAQLAIIFVMANLRF